MVCILRRQLSRVDPKTFVLYVHQRRPKVKIKQEEEEEEEEEEAKHTTAARDSLQMCV